MPVVIGILQIVLVVFVVLLFGRVAISLIVLFARGWRPRGLALILVEGTLSATDPPIRLVRSILPPINLGGVRLDLSVLILMILATLAIDLLTLAS
jgi:YggT family protein